MASATISRATLIAVVEAALSASGIPQPDADRIRQTARSTNAVAHGVWMRYGIGCPLVQAGCDAAARTDDENAYTRFYDSYDEQIRQWWMADNDGDRVPPRILTLN